MRTTARRRFLYASVFLALGALVLSAAQAFLFAFLQVGVVTGLILGALLQVLGLFAGAYGATMYSRSFPLNEAAITARRILVGSLAIVLPLAVLLTAGWALLELPEPSLVLLPALPSFWGSLAAFAAVGLVYAARELSSDRMAVAAGVGCGGVVAVALSAAGWSLADPVGTLGSARLVVDLLIVALSFVIMAFAFERDPWAARARRAP
jgi:hypothetical protein